MENIDIKEFANEEEKYQAIITATDEFDWIKFYNSGLDLNALILITPEQTIILTPIYRHAYAMNFIYKLLYGINVEDNADYEMLTNNITIRLVAGESIQVQSFYPETVLPCQKEVAINLMDDLTKRLGEIKFNNYFDQMIFSETYEDSMRKLAAVKVVEELDREILKDKVIIKNTQGKTR